MDNSIKLLKGSAFRDAVKAWHKTLGSDLYACDLDLVLVRFSANALAACLDVKKPGDGLTGTHRAVYDTLESLGIPVYLIAPLKYQTVFCQVCGKSDIEIEESSSILVTRYIDNKSREMTREQYILWERSLRQRGRIITLPDKSAKSLSKRFQA